MHQGLQEEFGTKNTKDSTNPSDILYSIPKGDSTHSRDKGMSNVLYVINCRGTRKCELISPSVHFTATPLQLPQYPLLEHPKTPILYKGF